MAGTRTRWFSVIVAGGLLAVPAAPAPAVAGEPEATVVWAVSDANSSDKYVDAVCPVGTAVYGGGGSIIDGGGNVLITELRPGANLTAVRVRAAENVSYASDWLVGAIAFCAPDNGHDLHLVEVPSTANGSNVNRSVAATCPEDEVLFGQVGPQTDPSTGTPYQVTVTAIKDIGFNGSFDAFAYAVCGVPNGSKVSVAIGLSAVGAAASHQAETAGCSRGSVTGVGGEVTGDDYGILLDRFAPDGFTPDRSAATRTTVEAWDNTGLGNSYGVTAFAICAS